jgi:hypothetical protein
MQSTLLNKPQCRVIIDATSQGSVFGQSGGDGGVVSEYELNALSTAVTTYMDWVEGASDLSSNVKDAWFQSALISPPMFEMVASNQEYKFDGYIGYLSLFWGFGTHGAILAILVGICHSWCKNGSRRNALTHLGPIFC